MQIQTLNKLYHGSNQYFETFDFNYAKKFKDFGKGFYLTSNFSQAQRWAQMKSNDKQETYIYCYSIQTIIANEWKLLEFLQYDKKWLNFITKCRIDGFETDHDIIYDRMADNQYTKLTDLLLEYMDNGNNANDVIDKIKWNTNIDQYCFKTTRSLSLLNEREVIIQHNDNHGKWRQTKK